MHDVQVKCPLLTSGKMVTARGATVATEDTYASMGLSGGAFAVALGKVLAKAESSSTGLIRGRRHFMTNTIRHARALVGGAVGRGYFRQWRGGTQAPDGGEPVAVIARPARG